MAAKFLVSALALASTAFAQCGSGDSITIKTSDDATQIASCETYDGDVIIDSSASGTIQLNGVQQIKGDLKCHNATKLSQISADQLNTIGGVFDLNGLTILTTLAFSSLDAVNRIEWIALPQLQGLNFNQGISKANQVYISNTMLESLAGIELTQVGTMDINNNNRLDTVNVNSLTNVTSALSFSANGRNLEIEFPNLEGAANLTFRNVTNVQMPSLSSVEGAIGFYSNSFESFAAPNLTSTGGTIAFVDSSALNNLSFPMLSDIGGGLQLANNSELTDINGFPALESIAGAMDFYGVFGHVQFPKLTDVRGGANVQTSSKNQSVCDTFNNAKDGGAIQGNVKCEVAQSNELTDGSNSSSSSDSSSSNAANSQLFDPSAPLTGLAALVAALLFL